MERCKNPDCVGGQVYVVNEELSQIGYNIKHWVVCKTCHGTGKEK